MPRGVGAASCPWLVAGLVSVAPVSPVLTDLVSTEVGPVEAGADPLPEPRGQRMELRRWGFPLEALFLASFDRAFHMVA